MSELSNRLRKTADTNDGARWEYQMLPCEDLMREAADEIERLQAIVDRLPKTADGVSITPGSSVWAWMGDAGLVETEIQRVGKGGWFAACYSTKEAAERARNQSNG